VRRREFVTLLGGAAVGWPLAARAQQPKVPTVGALVVGSPGSERFWRLFREGMRELGYIERQNTRYEFLSDEGKINRLPELAAELVRLKADVIVTWFTPPALAAKQATREIPVVIALAGNPVENGLVESLDRPGGNVTGMSGVGAELASKSVELIQELLPSARRVAALANAPDPFSRPFLEQIRLGGKATGVTIDAVMIRAAEELEAAFPAMEQKRPDAIIVQASLPAKRVAELALRYRIPSVGIIRAFAEEGGLMTYSFSEADMYRRAAIYVDKILKGAKPADLPIEQPTKFELVINLKTAKALGLTVPREMLARADEVID
jgi:putative tryptophan/tyrosine transport system substrate-binding protein